jgi:5-methylcytosine-specific restriction endonuclease McrA
VNTTRVLVLNASYEPINVCTVRRAVVLILKERAEVLEQTERVLHAETMTMARPAVIRLVTYVRIPRDAHSRKITRRAIFARDGWTCQYCGGSAENLDHVVPRSRGGLHVWENVVAACRRCNAKKMDRTPQEAGYRLHRQPFAPSDGFHLTLGRPDPGWEPFLI